MLRSLNIFIYCRTCLSSIVAPAVYSCTRCHRVYRQQCHLRRHERQCRNEEKLKCEICGKYETHRRDNLKRHRLVCLNRLTKSVFDSENASDSNSSGVSDDEAVPAHRQDGVRVPPVNMRPTPMYNRQRRHVNVCLSKNFPCDICNRPHGNMSELNAHRNVHFMPINDVPHTCLLYTSPSPRDLSTSRMPSSA